VDLTSMLAPSDKKPMRLLSLEVSLSALATTGPTTWKQQGSQLKITAQRSAAQCSAAQRSTAQHSTAQHSTAQHSKAQHSTAQHSTAQPICNKPGGYTN